MDCPTGENGRSLFDSNGMGSDMVYGFREVVGCFFGSTVGDRSIERGGTGFSAVCFGFFLLDAGWIYWDARECEINSVEGS